MTPRRVLMNDTTGPLDVPVARREPSSLIGQTLQLADNPLIPT